MRRGIVLFITLAAIVVLGGAVILFLKLERQQQDRNREFAALIQGNLLTRDLGEYLIGQSITPEELFAGSDIPVAMDLETVTGEITLNSAQSRIDINAFLKNLTKDQTALTHFLRWLKDREAAMPQLLLALLLDTLDQDLYERMEGSEIRRIDPRFQNGAIYEPGVLEAIVRRYHELGAEDNLSAQTLTRVFGTDPYPFDLNYASLDQLTLLYPEIDITRLLLLARHDLYYAKSTDLPFPPAIQKSLMRPRFGITPTLQSHVARVTLRYRNRDGTGATVGFYFDFGKKKRVGHITLGPVVRQKETE